MSKLKFGIESSQAVAENFKIFFDRLVRGYKSVTGRDPEGLDLLKIQLEAGEKARESAKVISMTDRTTINPSKGIIGGQQIKDSPEFGQKIRETYDAAKGPGKGQEMVDALKSPGAKKSYSIMEEQLGVKLYGDETFEEILEIQRTGKHPRGEPGSVITSESLKKKLMEGKNPFSDLVKTTQKGPKTLEQRRKEAEQALKNKNVKPIRESLEDFVDDAGGVNPDDPRGIDDFIPDPDKKADGGRAGFANGSPDAPSITLDAKGSRSGRQQIKDAPAGITSDEETFSAILKADIPVSEKIDLLSKLQYGKSRNRIEAGGQEIFLDEGGFKSRDIGLGFNKEALLEGSDSEGIGGTLMYNLETGEPEFNIGIKKRFADGGRIGLKDGMSRRKFMKIMGGIATLPILGKYIKPAMPLIKKGAEITGPALDKIVETVMSAGKLISQSGKRLKELTTKKKLKDVEVEEDIMDGPSYTIKTKDKTIYYRPGRQDEMGIDDDVIEVIEDTVTKKAGGGIARMLGE